MRSVADLEEKVLLCGMRHTSVLRAGQRVGRRQAADHGLLAGVAAREGGVLDETVLATLIHNVRPARRGCVLVVRNAALYVSFSFVLHRTRLISRHQTALQTALQAIGERSRSSVIVLFFWGTSCVPTAKRQDAPVPTKTGRSRYGIEKACHINTSETSLHRTRHRAGLSHLRGRGCTAPHRTSVQVRGWNYPPRSAASALQCGEESHLRKRCRRRIRIARRQLGQHNDIFVGTTWALS